MIRGLNKFTEHFAEFSDQYVLIGGTACTIAMEEVGLDFRATRDLDLVLCLEVLHRDFAEAFWQFIKNGGYEYRQKSTGKELFYRFHTPIDQEYPQMLELFSRKPDVITLINPSHLTPIPFDDETSSLSAILLNEEYYQFIRAGKSEKQGLPVLNPEYLIPLKARAWIDLFAKSNLGMHVDEKTIRKHKNDILRLYRLLAIENRVQLPPLIKQDMKIFLDSLKTNEGIDLKSFGMKNTNFDDLVNNLKEIYL